MESEQKPTEQYYVGSVFLSDHIESFVEKGLLIVSDPQLDDPHYKDIGDTFDEGCLDRAKYNVRLGKAYYKAGKFDYLDDMKNRFLTVEAYELVFVESYEVFEMPKNVVGVYDLRVSSCLAGLGLQTGLHLDPTYYGRVFCSLFNFSDTPVILEYKKQLGSIAFFYTTPPTQKTKHYGGRQRLFSLTQVLLFPRRSGLVRLWAMLQEFDRAATRLHTRIDTMVSAQVEGMVFMVAALAVAVAAVSVVITSDVTIIPIRVGIGAGVAIVIAGLGFYIIMRAIKKIK